MTGAVRLADPPARAPYGCDPAESRGRLYPEPESPNRTAFQRDRDRIIHSTAFRRLQYKTQVFVYHEGDHYRTRLTHSLEVAQVARSLARNLNLDVDLAEALALAHDLGHTPFGHAGEDALQAVMAPYGGFDHNGQSLRILTRLEARYAEFDGLNLTWETLEGIAKHNGPLIEAPGAIAGLPWALAEYAHLQDLELHSWPGMEAQVAALSDDIAYNTHDIDDGLRAGLFDIDDLAEIPLVGPIIAEVRGLYPDLQGARLIHETTRRLIDVMISDLLAETRRNLEEIRPASAAEVRALGRPLVSVSSEMAENNTILQSFLHLHMYRHRRINRMTDRAKKVVAELFKLFMEEPARLPVEWDGAALADDTARARLVADYIAGMTDRFALDEQARLSQSSKLK